MTARRCPGHYRHWFTLYRWVGVRRPDCARCGALNPKPLTPEEQLNYDNLIAHLRETGD